MTDFKMIMTIFVYSLLASCFVNTLGIDFLDTETVIVRKSPDGKGGLFGYSAVLHSLDANGNMIDNMRYDALFSFILFLIIKRFVY